MQLLSTSLTCTLSRFVSMTDHQLNLAISLVCLYTQRRRRGRAWSRSGRTRPSSCWCRPPGTRMIAGASSSSTQSPTGRRSSSGGGRGSSMSVSVYGVLAQIQSQVHSTGPLHCCAFRVEGEWETNRNGSNSSLRTK